MNEFDNHVGIIQKNLILELFPDCNLNCSFCMQDKLNNYQSKRSQYTSRSKLNHIENAMKSVIENRLHTNSVEMWGGEIFYDNSVEYTKKMLDLIKLLNSQYLTITTNLIWNIEDNVLFRYLSTKHPNFDLCISYDPLGRYSNEKMAAFFKNNLASLIKSGLGKRKTAMQYDVETVLTPEVLKQQVDLSYMDQLNSSSDINLLFIKDYRGYDEETIDNFNKYLFALYKRFDKCRDIEVLLENNLIDNNLCLCHQKTTTFLTYNNDFKLANGGACTYYIDHGSIKEKFYKLYGCKQCPYVDKCHDMCPSILNRLGFLKEGVYCYQRYMYDRLDELVVNK